MKFAVVVFPGSNCDHDAYHAAKHVLGQQARVRLAQGDVARRRRRRDPARRVLARRLPAHGRDRALLADHGRGQGVRRRRAARCSASATGSRFCSSAACCRARCSAIATSSSTASSSACASSGPTRRSRAAARAGQVLRLPIAHGEGNYYAPPDMIARARGERAASSSATPTPTGELTDEANPNGSLNNIAGICNEGRNVVGLMPHPERACEAGGRQRGRARPVRVGRRRRCRTRGVVQAVRADERLIDHADARPARPHAGRVRRASSRCSAASRI